MGHRENISGKQNSGCSELYKILIVWCNIDWLIEKKNQEARENNKTE